MTTERILASIHLSILSSPAKLGLYDNLLTDPVGLSALLKEGHYEVQDHIKAVYGEDPVKVSELILERCLRKNVSIINFMDHRYPSLLREIHRPPLLLYVKGNMIHGKTISIVGTRNSDRISEEIAIKISSALSAAGYTVVSGMAYGIDRFAHLGALNSAGATIGVLPGGIDTFYPYRNRDLYAMIAGSEKSAVISEYPPGITPGQKWTFAQRNRIISGISSSLVVVQAPRGSGAMITARYAIEQNRELFVCPGHAFDESYGGCHDLIREGAMIVSGIEDILSEIDPDYKAGESSSGESENIREIAGSVSLCRPEHKGADLSHYKGIEGDILGEMSAGKADIDSVTRKLSYTPEEINGAITVLEIDGIVTRKGNSIFMK